MIGLFNKNLTLLLLLAYIYVAIFGLVPMNDHHHSPMVNCPYMIGQSFCSMGVFEHIGAWKAYLLSIPVSQYLFIFFALAFTFAVVEIYSSPPLVRRFLYYKKIKFEPIISKLEQQFYDGILNPKPY